MTTTFETIEKENIEVLKFPHNEVLQSKEAINERKNDLNRAQALGNLEHSKFKIFLKMITLKKL